MKKRSIFLILSCFCFLILCFFAGCNSENLSSAENTAKEEHLTEQGKNFKLYTTFENENIYSRYEVFAENGEIIISEECHRPLTIWQISDHIVEIDVHVGTGMSDIRYCDIKRGLVSNTYCVTHPILTIDHIIIYDSEDEQKLKLVARDIFDEKLYYEEFVVDSEFHATLTGLESKGNNEIEVTYVYFNHNGESYQEVEKSKLLNLKN